MLTSSKVKIELNILLLILGEHPVIFIDYNEQKTFGSISESGLEIDISDK